MAKVIEYDVSEVEAGQAGGAGEPPLGIQDAEIMICRARDEKRDGSPANDIEVAFKINDDDDLRWLYEYVGLGEGSDWKLREFTDALGLPPKGKIDPQKLIGKKIKVNIKQGQYEGAPRAEVGRMLKSDATVEDDAGPQDDPAADIDPDFTPSIEGVGDTASYDEWDADDVKGEFEDRKLTVSGRKTQAAMIAALREDDAEPEAEAEADASGAADGFTPTREDDDNKYDDWDADEVTAEASDRGLTLGGGRGNAKAKAIKALREDDTAQNGDGGDDYDTWDAETLLAEVKDRGISMPRGKKTSETLIGLLRAHDAEPF